MSTKRVPCTWTGIDRDGEEKSGETLVREQTVPAMVDGFWNAGYEALEITREDGKGIGGIATPEDDPDLRISWTSPPRVRERSRCTEKEPF